jgi:thiol-disulfide isomerase/thioredoxin
MQPSLRLVTGAALTAAAALIALLLWPGRQAVQEPESPRTVITTAAPRQIGGDGGQWYNYAPDQFVDDVRTGRTVIVAVHADWCSDCRVQGPIITRLMKEPAYANAVGYVVDFDTERRFLADHKVRTQSTLIVFRNREEVARAVAITSEKDIRALFERGL